MPSRTPRLAALALAGALVVFTAAARRQPAPYDLVIRNARIGDGTGAPWYRGDVAVRGDGIAAIAPHVEAGAAREVDALGQVIAPGFIDIHTHARRGIFDVPTAPNYVRQGVTTLMEGPDGSSPLPLAPFLARVEALRKTTNIGVLVGTGSRSEGVIGSEERGVS